MTQVELARLDAPGTFVRFAAKIDGRTIGTSALLVTKGVVGIYLVSTLEAYRRMEIGTALTVAAAMEGMRPGLSWATLQASPMGEPIHRGIGFAKVASYLAYGELLPLTRHRFALSQHLAKMRAEGIVATGRESQTIWDRIADSGIEQLFPIIYALYCKPTTTERSA